MKKRAYAHYTDRFCEYVKVTPAPGKKWLVAYRAVREPEMDIRNVVSEYHSLVLPVAGETNFTQCGKSFPLRHGTVAIRRPNKPYSLFKTDKHSLEMFVFYFTSDVRPLWNRLFPKSCVGFHLSNGPEIVELTKAFFRLAGGVPTEQRTDLCDRFVTFLLETLALNRRDDPEKIPDSRLLRCVQHMERQFQRIRNAEEVARHFKISRGTLYNLFKNSAYVSPRKYLTRLKVDAATSLLTHTTWTLQEIADELGYESADVFSKAFKAATGITPHFYRKNH